MSNLQFILEHGALMIDYAIKPALLERKLDLNDDEGDMAEAFEALGLVESIAFEVGAGKSDFDLDKFLKIYPEYDRVARDVYREGLASIQQHDEDEVCFDQF